VKIGFIGLGRMGKNMVLNLLEHNHKVVVYNRSPEPTKEVARKGATGVFSIEGMVQELPKQKIIWLMVTSGRPVDNIIDNLLPRLKKGDLVVDGGNSFFKDSIRRGKILEKKKIKFLDIGVSGGIGGARHGACMMAGGDRAAYRKIEPLLKDLCVKDGYGYTGKSGAGHFAKMVHNGIEYGMMGAINEGMEAIKKHRKEFGFDLMEVSKVYANGSIIDGKLTKWLHYAYSIKGFMEKISCEVPKGETEDEMRKLEKIAEMRILHQAILMRERTRKKKYCGSAIAAMRNVFGGHEFKEE